MAAPTPPATGLAHRWIAGTGMEDTVGGGSPVTADGATVPRWEDQVGTAHLEWSSSVQRPTWDAKTRSIVFNEGADQRTGTTITSRNQNSVTMAIIGSISPLQRAASGTSGFWQGTGPTASPASAQYQVLMGGTPIALSYAGNAAFTGQNPGRFTIYNGSLIGTSVRITSTLSLFGFAGGASNVKVFQNNEIETVGSNGSSTFTDFYMSGSAQYTGAVHMILKEVLIYDHQLDSTELADLYTYAQRKYGVVDIEDAPQRIIQLGDSIGSGNFAANQRGYFMLSMQQFRQSSVYNFAESDNTLTKMNTEFATIITPILALSTARNVFLVEGGTNDLNGTTAATTYSRLTTLCATIRAADPNAKIIVSTVTPRTTTGLQTKIDDYNNLLRADFSRPLPWRTAFAAGPGITYANLLHDVAADPIIGVAAAAADTDLYTDGVHPTTAGHRAYAETLTPLLAALCGNIVDKSLTTGVAKYVRFDNGRVYDLTEGRGPFLARFTLPASAVELPDGVHTGRIFNGTAATESYDDTYITDVEQFSWRSGLLVTASEAAMMDWSPTNSVAAINTAVEEGQVGTDVAALPSAADNVTALLATTTTDVGSGTVGRALHYLRSAFSAANIFSTTALQNAPSGGAGGEVETDIIDASRTWYCEGYRARNIVEINASGGEVGFALRPDLNNATTINTVPTVLVENQSVGDDLTATVLRVDRSRTLAQFTISGPAAGNYTVTVTVTTVDGQTIVSTGTLKVH